MSQQFVSATPALSQSVSANAAIHMFEKFGAGKGNRTPLASLEG
jgi:hypothetical protein